MWYTQIVPLSVPRSILSFEAVPMNVKLVKSLLIVLTKSPS
jgi:hypothetical protein